MGGYADDDGNGYVRERVSDGRPDFAECLPEGPASISLVDDVESNVPATNAEIGNGKVNDEDVRAVHPHGVFPPVRYHDEHVTKYDGYSQKSADD